MEKTITISYNEYEELKNNSDKYKKYRERLNVSALKYYHKRKAANDKIPSQPYNEKYYNPEQKKQYYNENKDKILERLRLKREEDKK